MTKNLKIIITSILVLMLSAINPVFAGEIQPTETPNVESNITTSETTENKSEIPNQNLTSSENPILDGFIPTDTTIDEVNGWIDSKGEDILVVMQRIVQWVTLIGFVVCLIKAMFGMFGRGDMLGQALLGCILCIIVYAIITYIPELLELGKVWLTSDMPGLK